MAQSNIGTINPVTYTGSDLADQLPLMEQAIHSGHKGAARPAYATAGMIWVKAVSAARSEIMYFDGDHDHMILAVNPVTNAVIDAAAFLRDAGSLNAGTLPHARLPKASQAEAEAGTSASKVMTPERTKQAIGAAYTAADVRAKLRTVDGSGSGIDADRLDGQHGSYYRSAGNLNAGTLAMARLPVATRTEAQAGTSASKVMTPQRVAQAIEALVETDEYVSGEVNLAEGSVTTFVHGLGYRPRNISAFLVCKTAHRGYAIGDEVLVASGEVYSNWGLQIYTPNSTQIKIIFGSAGQVVLNASGAQTGQRGTISSSGDRARWKLKVRAS